MIALKEISHQIGDTPILSNVSLNIPKGKITALIGPNGAGKSTLLNLMARQSDLQTGQIVMDTFNLAKLPQKELALRLAVVAQHVGVASRLRIRDLVSFGRWPQHHGRPQEADKQAIDAALEKFDLTTIQSRFVDEVSGGQRQRAFVAMAYAQDTDWLLLDEPLNNLDIRYAKSLMAHLRHMADHDGKSIVIVIHDLNYALATADYFIGLKEGQVRFAGETGTEVTSHSLSDLFDTEVSLETFQGKTFAVHH